MLYEQYKNKYEYDRYLDYVCISLECIKKRNIFDDGNFKNIMN